MRSDSCGMRCVSRPWRRSDGRAHRVRERQVRQDRRRATSGWQRRPVDRRSPLAALTLASAAYGPAAKSAKVDGSTTMTGSPNRRHDRGRSHGLGRRHARQPDHEVGGRHGAPARPAASPIKVRYTPTPMYMNMGRDVRRPRRQAAGSKLRPTTPLAKQSAASAPASTCPGPGWQNHDPAAARSSCCSPRARTSRRSARRTSTASRPTHYTRHASTLDEMMARDAASRTRSTADLHPAKQLKKSGIKETSTRPLDRHRTPAGQEDVEQAEQARAARSRLDRASTRLRHQGRREGAAGRGDRRTSPRC